MNDDEQRDVFAGQAMQAIVIAHAGRVGSGIKVVLSQDNRVSIAKLAYDMADAMLEESDARMFSQERVRRGS